MRTFIIKFNSHSKVYKVIAGNAIDAAIVAITIALKEDNHGYSINDVSDIYLLPNSKEVTLREINRF